MTTMTSRTNGGMVMYRTNLDSSDKVGDVGVPLGEVECEDGLCTPFDTEAGVLVLLEVKGM